MLLGCAAKKLRYRRDLFITLKGKLERPWWLQSFPRLGYVDKKSGEAVHNTSRKYAKQIKEIGPTLVGNMPQNPAPLTGKKKNAKVVNCNKQATKHAL